MKKSNRFASAILFASLVGSLGTPPLASADDTLVTARQKISRNGGVYLLEGKPAFFSKNRAGQAKTLNDIWKVLDKNGVAVARIDVVRVGETVVVFSYSPNGGLLSK